MQADAKGVSFDVTNTGDCAGDEVAQLYIHKPNAEAFRPAKELKGFQRVHLEKGETKRVTIPFDGYTFRYFNVRTNRFEVEGGEYELLIGASCRDIRLTAKHTEQGTNAPNPYSQLAVQSYRTARVTDVSDAEFTALLGHAIPPHLWDKTQPLTLNDTVTQLSYAKNPLARLIYRILTRMKNKATAAGKPGFEPAVHLQYPVPRHGEDDERHGVDGNGGGYAADGQWTFLPRVRTAHPPLLPPPEAEPQPG